MRRRARARTKQRAHVALLLIAVISLLLMPVDYRAGATVAHPHSVIELFNDLAHGSLIHHVHDASRATDHHRVETERRQSTERAAALPSVAGPQQSAPGVSAVSIRAALTILHSDAWPANLADDAPTLTPRTATGKFVAFPLALPLTAILLWRGIAMMRPWFQECACEGRTPAPELPPPRYCPRLFTPSVPYEPAPIAG